MSNGVRQLENRLRHAEFDTLFEIEATNLALDYARNRYFEIELRITNERISRLEKPESITDLLIWVALGGIVGPVVASVVSRLIGKLLSNHLVYVRNWVRTADLSPKDRDKVLGFLGLLKVTPTKIAVTHFLNKDSVEGRLYRFLPEFIGSRFDEIIQQGPLKDAPFWPTTAGVSDFVLQNRAWYTVQEITVRQEFQDIRDLLRNGDNDEIKSALDERDSLLSHFGSEQKVIVENLVDRARPLGEFFLLALFTQRYGPADRLAEVKIAHHPVKLTKSGGFERRYIEKIGDSQRLILEILVKELNHPFFVRPITYFERALDEFAPLEENQREKIRGIIKDNKAFPKESGHLKYALLERAAVELLGHMDMIYKEMRRSPVPPILQGL